MHDDKRDAVLIDAALLSLSRSDALEHDEAEMSRIWLRARFVSLAGRDSPVEALMSAGVVASAAIAGFAALGLTAAFWTAIYQAAPFAVTVAVVTLSVLAVMGGALTLKAQV